MAEHDYVIANQNGANTRSDLNNALAAIVSNNSKATAPTTTYAFMLWADTANDILKQRNAADSAWISILTLSTGAPLGTLSSSLLSGALPAIDGSALTGLNPLTSGTAVASTSGTSIDFTGIPSWVKKITLSLNGVSTTGTSNYLLQLGDAGGVETSGYLGATSNIANGVATLNFTTGLAVTSSVNASYVIHGIVIITLVDVSPIKWEMSYTGSNSFAAVSYSGSSSKSLSAALDRIRITTVAGADTFDAGTINILYE